MSKERALDLFGALKSIADQVDKLREERDKISNELEDLIYLSIAEEGTNEVNEIEEYEEF